MITLSIDSIDETTLQNLIDNSINEGKNIEFKELLKLDTNEDKKEFLFDVSSFANASGGEIFYGVKEDKETGAASDLVGLSESNFDNLILRIESLIRTGVSPRIAAVQSKVVTLSNGKSVLLLRIPASWNSPHMVTLGGTDKFYSRGSNGKFKLDVLEIKNAFLASETVLNKISSFRSERINKILSGEAPIDLGNGGKIIIHLVPISTFQRREDYDLRHVIRDVNQLKTFEGFSSGARHNFEGYISYAYNERHNNEGHNSYLQIYRNGIIESTSGSVLTERNGNKVLHATDFERKFIWHIESLTKILSLLEIEFPVILFATLMDVKGSILATRDGNFFWDGPVILKPNTLDFPNILYDEIGAITIPSSFVEWFNLLYRAFGYPKCSNTDNDGNYIL